MSMMPFNFNQLYYFWVIAKAGSITAATRQLLLNQSTLSQQLHRLEQSVGRRLLLRSRRGIVPTQEGAVVFDYCERIFGQAEELASRLRGGEVARIHTLRLGFARSIAREKVLAVVSWLRARHGGLVVRMASGTLDGLEDRLRRRVHDVVLSNEDLAPLLGRDFRSRLVASIPHFFMVSSRRKRSGSFPRMMEHLPLMVRPPDNAIHKEAIDFLRRNGVVPNVHSEVDDPDLILTFVLRGEAAGVLDPLTVHRHLKSGKLVKLHERSLGIRENLWLVCSRHPHSSEPVQKAIDGLMEGFRLDHQTIGL